MNFHSATRAEIWDALVERLCHLLAEAQQPETEDDLVLQLEVWLAVLEDVHQARHAVRRLKKAIAVLLHRQQVLQHAHGCLCVLLRRTAQALAEPAEEPVKVCRLHLAARAKVTDPQRPLAKWPSSSFRQCQGRGGEHAPAPDPARAADCTTATA